MIETISLKRRGGLVRGRMLMLEMSNCPSSVARMMTMAWRANPKICCRRDAENFMH